MDYATVSLIKFVVFIMFVAHWLACALHVTVEMQGHEDKLTTDDGVVLTSEDGEEVCVAHLIPCRTIATQGTHNTQQGSFQRRALTLWGLGDTDSAQLGELLQLPGREKQRGQSVHHQRVLVCTASRPCLATPRCSRAHPSSRLPPRDMGAWHGVSTKAQQLTGGN